MKVWFVFSYNIYYPQGGMADFCDSFETEEEANEYVTFNLLKEKYDVVEIVNILDKL